MKKFKVSINTGLSGEFEVERKDELMKKLSSGHYSLMGVRDLIPTKITSKNIVLIERIHDEQ